MNNATTSRRDFIKATAAVAGAAGLPLSMAAAQDAANDTTQPPAPINVDIAIVGAGVAGCYAAYRLRNIDASGLRTGSELAPLYANNMKPSVGLFEYSGRVGGRLLSPLVGNDENKFSYRSEFGGFRFNRQMQIVWNTAQHLKLEDEPFFFDAREVTQQNIVFIKTKMKPDGVTLTQKQVAGGDYGGAYDIPAELVTATGGSPSPGNLFDYVANQVFNGTLENWPDAATDAPTSLLLAIAGPKYKGQPRPDLLDAIAKSNLPPAPAPNGYSSLYLLFHAAFNEAQLLDMKVPNTPEDKAAATALWALVRTYGEMYEAAKATNTIKPLVFGQLWDTLKMKYLIVNGNQDAYDAVSDTSGYDVGKSAGNGATNLDEDFYFATSVKHINDDTLNHPNTEWRHLTQGYSALPDALFEGFKKTGNDQTVPFRKNYQLLQVDNAQGGGYSLTFFKREPGPSSDFTLDQIIPAKADQLIQVNAKYVILAIPKTGLQALGKTGIFNSPQVRSLLFGTNEQDPATSPIVDIKALRMFVAYPNAWWRNAPAYQGKPLPVGRATTTLPFRQCYYWDYMDWTTLPEGGHPPATSGDLPALLLASYVNGVDVPYWSNQQGSAPPQPGQVWKPGPYFDPLAGAVGPINTFTRKPSNAPQKGGPRHGTISMAQNIHQQLVEAHGLKLDEVPPPFYVHFQDWDKFPWGAGWHSFNAGADQQSLIPMIYQPTQEKIYIVGESYSNVQGWVWGAMNSVEATLQCKLGLAWPDFINPIGTWLGPGTNWLLPGQPTNPCVTG